jgi:hypothetical protein
MENLISLSEAARRADRSKACIRRWINEGWIPVAKKLDGRNGQWLLDGDEFDSRLPHILETMENRKGGQGKKETDGYGNPRD